MDRLELATVALSRRSLSSWEILNTSPAVHDRFFLNMQTNSATNRHMNYIVGVDIGGTFIDCVAMDEQGAVTLGKALSTPDDFAIGAINAVADAARNLGLKNENELLATKPSQAKSRCRPTRSAPASGQIRTSIMRWVSLHSSSVSGAVSTRSAPSRLRSKRSMSVPKCMRLPQPKSAIGRNRLLV
jgi:hydantoinase/oxoprolinase-like protein